MALVRPVPELDSALRSLFNAPPAPTRVYLNGGGTPAPEETEDPDAPVLEFSARGRVEVLTLESMGVKVIWPEDKDATQTEISRTTHTVRVFNPEDDSQYVDVEVIDELTVENIDKIQRRWKFTGGLT